MVALVGASCAASGSEASTAASIGSEPDSSVRIEVVDPSSAADGEPSPPAGPDGGNGPQAVYSIVAQATVPAITARVGPADDTAVVAELGHPTPSGSPLVFRAVDDAVTDPEWIEVHLPIEPNGTTGWIRRDEVSLSNNPYRIEIDRASYSLTVFDLDEIFLETTIAVGTGDTPTPVGEFYLLELLAPPNPDGPYGPFAFGLSGFSEVLSEFGGADTAIIGLHGTNDPGSLGTDVSHGCIRLANPVIESLAATLPLGTPVRIT